MVSGLLEEIYINVGTWRAARELTHLQPNQQQSVGCHVMTYLAILKETEREGRGFETWEGMPGKP